MSGASDRAKCEGYCGLDPSDRCIKTATHRAPSGRLFCWQHRVPGSARMTRPVRQDERPSDGECLTCTKPRAPGRARCWQCLDKRAAANKRYQQRLVERACTACGGSGHSRGLCPTRGVPEVDNTGDGVFTRCSRCLKAERADRMAQHECLTEARATDYLRRSWEWAA